MATTEADISVDLDVADAAKAAKAAEAAKKATPEPVIEVVKADETPKPADVPILTPDAGLEKLKKQLEDEKSARIAAERQAAESAEAERQARTENQGTQLDLVTNAIATVTQANDALEGKYAEALAAQDFAAAARINREMSGNSAKLLQLENGKAALEKAPKPQIRVAADPVEKFASQLSPRSAAWVRQNPEFVRNPTKNAEMLAAHQLALARGLKADTDEYFTSIERTLDLAKPAIVRTESDPADDPMADAAQPSAAPSRKAPPAAAPVSRSGNGTGSRSNVYRASAAEVEAAEFSGMSVEDYIRNREALKKEGKLN